jgi:hypothetical protein
MASLPLETVSQQGGNALLVILNPSPFVTLSEAKGLDYRLRINSVKNLMEPHGQSPWFPISTPEGANIPYQRTNSPTGRTRGPLGSG